MQKYSWPLSTVSHSWLDRLKLAAFFLKPSNQWTQGNLVKRFEDEWAEYTGANFAVMTSSGSTSNTLIFQYVKDSAADFRTRNVIVLPSLTWQTACAPALREGFKPHFIDVRMDDFSLDYEQLEEYLSQNSEKVALVFVTNLLGFVANILRLSKICKKYNVRLMFDNCESSLSSYSVDDVNFHVCQNRTSSTSCYLGHFINSCEGGIIFTNSEEEYAYFLMNRNHSMTRSLLNYRDKISDDWYNNVKDYCHKIDPKFDFYGLGNNFRNSDIHALIGLLDFQRVNEYTNNRQYLYYTYCSVLNKSKYHLPANFPNRNPTPFALPIIAKESNKSQYFKAKMLCDDLKIETRPIISGWLGYQRPYSKYMKAKDHPNSIYLNDYGFYVGLHPKLKESQVIELAERLNAI